MPFELSFATVLLGVVGLLLLTEAAVVRHRVVNGQVARPRSYSSQVVLRLIAGDQVQWCGGTLVNIDSGLYVLTASHCIYSDGDLVTPDYIQGFVAPSNLSNVKTRGVPISFARVLLHEQEVNSVGGYRDVALLQVAHVAGGAQLQPAYLPTRDEYLTAGTVVPFVAYGRFEESRFERSDVPRETQLKVLEDRNCRWDQRMEPPYTLCLIAVNNNCWASEGDSGSGVIVKLGPRSVVMAVQFRIENECRTRRRAVFMNISALGHWIKHAVANMHKVDAGLVATVGECNEPSAISSL